MSLFKTREWWSTRVGDSGDDFDEGAICVANIDNSFSQDNKSNLKIIVGSHQGYLRIFFPQKKEFKAEDLICEYNVGSPILQVEAGRFFINSTNLGLAVLQPKKIVVYSVSLASGNSETGDTGTYYNFEKKYEHSFKHVSYNFTYGNFGGVADRDFLCVQSMDGMITIYEQDRLSFSTYLTNFLLPGPIIYVSKMDSILTGNSQYELECYKYSNLATSQSQRKDEEDLSSPQNNNSKKKLQTDWALNLGETIVALQVVKFNRNIQKLPDNTESDYDIVVLGEKTLFFVLSNGNIRNQKKLDYHPSCLTSYIIDEKNIFSNLIVGTHNNSINILKESQLIWASSIPSLPIAIKVATFSDVQGLVVCLDDRGVLSVNYLGTDPSSSHSVVNIQPENKQFNYEEMDKELRRLQAVIRQATSGTKSDPTDKVDISIIRDEDMMDKSQTKMQFKLNLLYQGNNDTVENVAVNIDTSHPFVAYPRTVIITLTNNVAHEFTVVIQLQSSNSESVNEGNGDLCGSLKFSVCGAFVNSKGEARSFSLDDAECSIPLSMACKIVPTIKNSAFKVIIDTNKEPVPLNTLFEDVFLNEDQANRSTTSNVISFRYICNLSEDATITTSKSAGRYRIQSQSSFEAISLITQELVLRSTKYFGNLLAQSNNIDPAQALLISYTEEKLPLQEYFGIIDKHFGLRMVLGELKKKMEDAATQFRAVQKRLLVRYKDKNPAPLHHLDILVQKSYDLMVQFSNEHINHAQSLNNITCRLSCATELVLLLLKHRFQMDSFNFNILRSHLSPIPMSDGANTSDQNDNVNGACGWEETTMAAMENLLRNLSTNSGESLAMMTTQLRFPEDTSRLKKQIMLVCDRLSKGINLGVALGIAVVNDSKETTGQPKKKKIIKKVIPKN